MGVNFSALTLAPCLRVFGDRHVFRPQNGEAFEFVGVFDAAAQIVEAGGEVGFATTRPIVGIRFAEFPADPTLARVTPRQDDRAVILGRLYQVVEVQPDNVGAGATLILHDTTLPVDPVAPRVIDFAGGRLDDVGAMDR